MIGQIGLGPPPFREGCRSLSGGSCRKFAPVRGRQCPQYGCTPRPQPSRCAPRSPSCSPVSLPVGLAAGGDDPSLQVSRELTVTATDIATHHRQGDARSRPRASRSTSRSSTGRATTRRRRQRKPRQDLHRGSEQDPGLVHGRHPQRRKRHQPGAGLDQRPDPRHGRGPAGEEGRAARPRRRRRLHVGRRLRRAPRRQRLRGGTEAPGAVGQRARRHRRRAIAVAELQPTAVSTATTTSPPTAPTSSTTTAPSATGPRPTPAR